jgi:hypothetical protein
MTKQMTYTVTAIDSRNRVCVSTATHKSNVQVPLDVHSARSLARKWRKDPSLRDVRIISRDEYGRGHVEP